MLFFLTPSSGEQNGVYLHIVLRAMRLTEGKLSPDSILELCRTLPNVAEEERDICLNSIVFLQLCK